MQGAQQSCFGPLRKGTTVFPSEGHRFKPRKELSRLDLRQKGHQHQQARLRGPIASDSDYDPLGEFKKTTMTTMNDHTRHVIIFIQTRDTHNHNRLLLCEFGVFADTASSGSVRLVSCWPQSMLRGARLGSMAFPGGWSDLPVSAESMDSRSTGHVVSWKHVTSHVTCSSRGQGRIVQEEVVFILVDTEQSIGGTHRDDVGVLGLGGATVGQTLVCLVDGVVRVFATLGSTHCELQNIVLKCFFFY